MDQRLPLPERDKWNALWVGCYFLLFTFLACILDCNSKCVKRILWTELEWCLTQSKKKHKFTRISINYSALKFFLSYRVFKAYQQQQQNPELEIAH